MNKSTNIITILIVDDYPTILKTISQIVQIQFPLTRILTANDGNEGWLKARQDNPDLIITDLFMPNMNGFELVQRLRRRPKTRQMPVVGISGVDRADPRVQAFAELCDEFLPKPVDPKALIDTIVALLPCLNLDQG